MPSMIPFPLPPVLAYLHEVLEGHTETRERGFFMAERDRETGSAFAQIDEDKGALIQDGVGIAGCICNEPLPGNHRSACGRCDSNSRDAFNARDLVKQKFLIVLHVRYHNLELVVSRLSCDK